MTDTRVLTGGVPTDVLAMATADQDTIVGNGTIFDPLRAGSGPDEFVAEFSNPFSDPNEPRIGQPVVVTEDDPAAGICVVRTANADPANLLPYVLGLIVDTGSGSGQVTVRTSGEVTATIEDWNFVVGNDEGLITGDVYYLDASGFGQMFQNQPTTPGAAIAQIGIALSSTTMLLAILPPLPRIVA